MRSGKVSNTPENIMSVSWIISGTKVTIGPDADTDGLPSLGQRVKVLVQDAVQPGYHRAVWAGDDAAGRQVGSGIYFYRVRVGEAMQVGRMTLVK